MLNWAHLLIEYASATEKLEKFLIGSQYRSMYHDSSVFYGFKLSVYREMVLSNDIVDCFAPHLFINQLDRKLSKLYFFVMPSLGGSIRLSSLRTD